ncbi:MAG: hypothetical protein A2157_13755 [Deltaproteobacteria bacterium RBG_16_47_11]|nr:MAG: hypothetical protein A2157_13755 [Deltaproteobacteria bacterium RBG_16_47_11]
MKKFIWINTAITFCIVLSIVSLLFYFTFDRQITGFFCIGDIFPMSPYIDKSSAYVFKGKVGYDGQFFLAIALDPGLRNKRTIDALDNPKFRYRRIAYPVVGYIIGLGNIELIPYAMVGVNILCIVTIVLLISVLFQIESAGSRYRWLPVLILAIPGVWVTLCTSTADLLGTTLFTATLVGLRLCRNGLASVALCLACLTRETYLGVAMILIVLELRRNSGNALWLSFATVPALLWNALVYVHIREGTSGIRENFGVPFAGILAKWQAILEGGLTIKNLYEAYAFGLLMMAGLFLAASMIRTRRQPAAIPFSVLPYLVILITSKMQIFGYFANYLRVFIDIFLVNILITLREPADLVKKRLLLLYVPASVAYVIHYIFIFIFIH